MAVKAARGCWTCSSTSKETMASKLAGSRADSVMSSSRNSTLPGAAPATTRARSRSVASQACCPARSAVAGSPGRWMR